MNNVFFSIVLGLMGEFVGDIQGFTNGRGFDRVENFGLGLIHDNSFGDREIICAPLNKFRALGGLVDKEKNERKT